MEYQDIQIEQLDESIDLIKLNSFKEKMRPFRFIEFLNNKEDRTYEKIKLDFFSEVEVVQINLRNVKDTNHRRSSFLDIKQKDFSNYSTLNSSMKSINEERLYFRQMRQNNRKKLLLQMKQNDEYSLNGSGVIKLKDGRVIFGTWRCGLLIGIVKIIYPYGNTYVGDVINYIRHGHGEFNFTNGDKYIGAFVNGKVEGFGKMYYKQEQRTIQGIWQNGVYLRP